MEIFGKFRFALWGFAALSTLSHCSAPDRGTRGEQDSKPSGGITLSLMPVSGLTLTSLHYVIDRAGAPVVEGDLPTPGAASTLSFAVPVPVGIGYRLSLSGVSQEQATTTCTGSAGPFDVSANTSNFVALTVTCSDRSGGSVGTGVSVITDACPRLSVDSLIASPSTAHVGEKISLAGVAHDADGALLAYAWRAVPGNTGSFDPPNARLSAFTCTSGGSNIELKLEVDNGHCKKSLSANVSCVQVLCGNGQLDPSEPCDPTIPVGAPGWSPNCNPNCTHPVCGNGIVELGETCDPVPANPQTCNPSTCQLQSVECGDGILSPIEPCDGNLFPAGTPAGAVCKPDCSGIQGNELLCGNGFTDPQEVCDPGLSADDCGKDCKRITSSLCRACEASPDTCLDYVSCDTVIGNAAAGTPAAGTPKRNLCNEVLDCVRDSGCAANGVAPIRCYCGTANPTDCQAGLANGPCKTEIERGLETTAFATIAQRIGNTSFGGGQAMARIDCDQAFCPLQCFSDTTPPINPCGNGKLDAGEACDPSIAGTPAGTCSAGCTLLPKCGNGVLDAGEACDPTAPGSPAFCTPSCTLPVCGNGVVEAPEQCDPLVSTPTCVSCQNHITCGDGVLSPGELCDGTLFPPGTPANVQCVDCTPIQPSIDCGNGVKESLELCDPQFTVDDCGANCGHITNAACLACESTPDTCLDFTSCSDVIGNAAAGSPAAGTPKRYLCNETLDCVRDSGCAANGVAPIKCYCGSANPTDCQAGLANGPCKAQIERSLETTAFATIAQRIGNTSFGGGMAMARIDCDQAFCPTQCF